MPPGVVIAPMVMPLNVTVTKTLGATFPDCSVITILDKLLEVDVAVAFRLNATDGVTPTAKKPGGYASVTVFPAESAPPAVGVKLNVTFTPVRFTTRSELAMSNATAVTAPPMYPDAKLADVNGS